MPAEPYELFIIGAGQAGLPLAHAFAKAGWKVAIAEREHLGGSCVNFGCTPTKAVLASARLAHRARRAADFGLRIPSVDVDFAAVLKRAREQAEASRSGLVDGFGEGDNPMLLRGHARFRGRTERGFELEIEGRRYDTERVVIDAGTRTRVPDIEGLGQIDFIHAENWLDHEALPDHLVVLGAGPIGLEMAQFYRRMGSEVTLLQDEAQIASKEDEDVARALQAALEEEGIAIRTGCRVSRLAATDGGIEVATEQGHSVQATHLFVATGRRPNTDDLGLETVGLEVTDEGFVEVDERLATDVEGIWATGDVHGGPMFTHVAWDDHRVLLSQLKGDGSKTTARNVPYGVFTDPQLGRVGLTEREARASGATVNVACYEMADNGKAREIGETAGFVKVIIDAETDRILGAAVLASEGAELVHTYILAMNADVPCSTIYKGLHIHPTLSEALHSVLKSVT